MKLISWSKINRPLMFQCDRKEAIERLQKNYQIVFPIYRLRSQSEVAKLDSYEDVVDEYASSGKKTSTRKNQLIWGK